MFIQAFLEGIVIALGALVFELSILFALNLPASDKSLISLFICVAIEEILKYAIIFNRYLHSNGKEKILYVAFFIGLGFSSIELFLKQIDYQKTSPFYILGLFFIHTLTASIIGFLLQKKFFKTKLSIATLLALVIALHFGYNFLILHYF
jgi:RsiW-degrading membrane proteinase PrsW (M82 family)